MANRSELQARLEAIPGVSKVYFQPPASVKLVFPCIIFSRSGYDKLNADNMAYQLTKKYTITAIYRDPDSTIPDTIAAWNNCSFDRSFVIDGLYHDVYTLYF